MTAQTSEMETTKDSGCPLRPHSHPRQQLDTCHMPPARLVEAALNPVQFPQTWQKEQGTKNFLFCLGNPSQGQSQGEGFQPQDRCGRRQVRAAQPGATSVVQGPGPRFSLKGRGLDILPGSFL